eukprot:c30253_g1_i1 orf=121-1452(+)
MANLRTDSPLVRRIVLCFLDFLSAVDVAPGVDREGIEVASQCLMDTFGLDACQVEEQAQPNLLPDLFASAGLEPVNSNSASAARKPSMGSVSEVLLGSSSPPVPAEKNGGDASKDLAERLVGEESTASVLNRLFEQFREGLESAGHFDGASRDTPEYFERVNKARTIFEQTVEKMNPPSLTASEHRILAEAFKVQGNNAMVASHYIEAIDLYTLAISLCGDNAVYYSNRAAAHTQVGKYEAAIGDCNKAVQIDPNYSKAYSRLGLAYYAQGRYQESIDKGFKKAFSLDPNSKSIQENLQAAQQKLEEQQSYNRQQHPEQTHQQEESPQQSSGQGVNSSIPFNIQLPPEMANLLPNIANLAAHFSHNEQTAPANPIPEDGSSQNSDGPEVRLNGNINVTFEGDQLPPQFAGLMQSMLQMFAGSQGQQTTPPETQQSEDNQTRRS